jgi:hypothetical protein
MQVPETGETTTSIIRRGNDEAWAAIRPMMENGTLLKRAPKPPYNYYTQEPCGFFGAKGLTPGRVAKLVRDGEIEQAGADTYRLAGNQS